MLSELGRCGALGVVVTFRLEGSEEFLWTAPMQMLPTKDDLVGQLLGEETVATWYKVEEIKFEFDHEYGTIIGPDGQPIPWTSKYEHYGVCIFVSVV